MLSVKSKKKKQNYGLFTYLSMHRKSFLITAILEICGSGHLRGMLLGASAERNSSLA